ncbi:MAG: endonuclease MutS2 [Dehalococcoidales bacterium]|nr:endonuclease MutS2 [Dehalococcoidales bacterium]
MDTKSLEMLEFHRVREILAGYTSFPASHAMALELKPNFKYEEITLLFKQSSEARQLLATEPDFHIGAIEDIREAVGMAARGKVLEPPVLSVIAQALSNIRYLHSSLNKFAAEFPSIWNIAKNITELRSVEKSIDTCISTDGEILDSASPHLSFVRQQIRNKRHQLMSNLENFIRSPGGQKIVQEQIVTEREGRYVIPVKIEAKKDIKGIVHDVSNTGATIFIEPWETVEEGNELRESINEEKREVDRILTSLSKEVGLHEAEINQDIVLAAELDFIFAKAKYARRARATEPRMVAFNGEQRPSLQLLDARHPLLSDRAVPLDITIGKDYSILVITGPNTGGKTVALKTIGLLSLMALAGIPIPASEKSQIPVFDGVFVDIGDEQSIEQTLSTFSWHISNITRIIHSATDRSMVLLDELGTSTDPAEGSALARAILLYFLSKSTATIATTHLGDLKVFAHVTPGLQNASLDFDPVTLAPTYHLTVGLPGGSNALATAARLGLDAEIISHAREMLSKGTQEVETLLSHLTEERDKAQSTRLELEKVKRDAELLKKEFENKLKELKTREKTVIQETRDRIVSEAADLQREIRQAATELRKQKSRDTIERTKKTLASVQEKIRAATWQPQTSPETETETEPDNSIAIGDTVYLKEANLEAIVLKLDEVNREIEVQAGHTRIKMGLGGVEKIVPSSSGTAPSYIPLIRPPPPKAVPSELMMLGKRAEEVELMLNKYLDDASLTSLKQVRIVHGSGTGTLRQIVRELLSTHPLVKSFRPGEKGEGGNGVTVVRL